MVRTYWFVLGFNEASSNLDLQPFARVDHVEACRPRAWECSPIVGRRRAEPARMHPVNERNLARHIEETVGIVTALNPVIGYERATELATEAYRSNKGILEIVREKHILTEDQIRALLDPAKLTGLDRGAYPKTKKP